MYSKEKLLFLLMNQECSKESAYAIFTTCSKPALVKPRAMKAAPGRSTSRKRRKHLLTINYRPLKGVTKI